MFESLNDLVPASGMLVVADLEYTSWEGALEGGWSEPGQFRETVQIGAVRVDVGDGFTERGAFSVLVRPTLNPELSDYFVDLTGISNAVVARDGTDLACALGAFTTFVGADAVLSHGRDDAVISNECAFKEMPDPLVGLDWRDINPAILDITGRRMPSSALPEQFGLEPAGSAHDALADARSLARVLAHLRDAGRI